ncbi:hypothetical protein GCM10022600_15100 [Qipengyuania pelagi]|uniref:Helix-turn-helix domain-containing protein n=1 Tax=Qipengyuania pelagi TaxID=994320 RepID=A0A844Y636_9SPHN|nr:helix-turn-helix transcriptional regulator [Qipengyuania pelagi]MXO53635.1 helix-turn-helix domain-containing protein [Qipengyuania pelagi]
MTTETQFFFAPDGTEMAVLPRERLDRMIAASEDTADRIAAETGLASLAEEGGIPFDVESRIAEGVNPVRAWRDHRRFSQAQLAEKASLTQAAIARLEGASPGSGRPETLDAIAAALDAPRWTLEAPVPEEKGPKRTRALFDRANPAERRLLRSRK